MAFALFPDAMRRAMATFALMEPQHLRMIGVTAVIVGAALLFLLADVAGGGQPGILGFSAIRGAIAALL